MAPGRFVSRCDISAFHGQGQAIDGFRRVSSLMPCRDLSIITDEFRYSIAGWLAVSLPPGAKHCLHHYAEQYDQPGGAHANAQLISARRCMNHQH